MSHRTAGVVLCSCVVLMLCTVHAAAKSGPTWHTREEIAHVRKRCRTEDWAIEQREKAIANAARWVAMTDEELWEFVLDTEIPRALNVNFGVGCPVHGKEVFQKGGHYPWIMSSEEPFKVTCPIGGETYPSNDYAAYLRGGRQETLDTTEPYVDDGHGYVAPDGQRYWFVAHYVFWQRWRRDIFSAMDALSHAYLLTGDPAYAHKLGVLLGRMVEVYPRMDYSKQAYHNGKWPAGISGRILDYVWENRTIQRFASSYDAVYDAIDQDDELKAFLAERGIADLKRAFEQEVLHFMARDVMEGRIRGNMYYQPTLATLAIVLDNDDPGYGPTTREMVDWLLYGDGEIQVILHGGFDRDGAGGESAPGYSSSWNTNFCKVAELLARLGCDVTNDPHWRKIIQFPYNVTLAGSNSPRIGDCGGTIHSAPKLVNVPVLTFGYNHFRDPRCAQLLLEQDAFGDSLWGETLDREDVERVASSVPDATDLRTRNLGGYGLGVFDTGEDEIRRAAYMYYGGPDAWHGHHDRLNIGYIAHGRDFLPEMGYPAHWDNKGERFTRGMPSHYNVMIHPRRSWKKTSGYLDFFAAGRRTRVMRGHAEAIYAGMAEVYRRTFAMIDTGDQSFLVDLFHVRGGNQHSYHFHGLPFGEFSAHGLEFVDQQKTGTLLGPDVAWGSDTSDDCTGYDFLRNVRRYRAGPAWCARWAGMDECSLAYWMPSFPEVLVCDGEPPLKPDYPETMEFLVVRNPAHETRFPAVISPSRLYDPVLDVGFEQDDDETRYSVQTTEGRWRIAVGDAGAFSAAFSRPDGSAYAFFANHADVAFAGKQYRLRQSPSFTITSVDYASNVVTVEERVRDPKRLVGEVCVVAPRSQESPVDAAAFTNSASYTVVAADRHHLHLEGPATTGIVIVDESDGTTLRTRTRLSGYGVQMGARALVGMALVDEALEHAVGIAAVEQSEGVTVFQLTAPAAFTDIDGDGRIVAHFADFAPGYAVTFAPWIELEQAAGGVSVDSNVRFRAR